MIPAWAAIPLTLVFSVVYLLDQNWSAAWWAFSCAMVLFETRKLRSIMYGAADDFNAYYEKAQEVLGDQAPAQPRKKLRRRADHLRVVER